MKANEAPEKLYVDTEDRLSDSILYGFIQKHKDDDIEYTRTDAFIEKAVSYLNSKLYDWVRIEHPNPSVSPELIIKQDFIEDFKTYMKGE